MSSIHDEIRFEQKGIGEVLNHGRLVVPLNQREYSWQESHVSNLFQDLSGAMATDKTYFLGTIVLTRGDNETPEVSDGQQRLATTTILMAAIRDWFYRNNEMDRAQAIEDSYLREYDLEEVRYQPRLRLNVDDNDFFVRYILARPDDPERRIIPMKESHKLISKAAEIAAQHVRGIIELYAGPMQKTQLVRWVKFIRTEAQVIVLRVSEDIDAFLIFETLNDRGLRASQADLLKNYLLSQSKEQVVEGQQKWAQMIAVLDSLDQGDMTVTYLHHMLITRHGQMRAVESFGKVKATVEGQTQALRFLNDAAEGANDYAALFNPDHAKWNPYGTLTRKHISTINKDLRVQQIRPLMLAVARNFSIKEAQKAFQLFVYWSVRFLFVGGRGGVLDRLYGIAAQKVGAGTIKTAAELTDSLIDSIPPDRLFEATFSESRVSATNLARYYLRALGQKVNGAPQPEYVASEDEIAINLEHILPENPQDEWPDIRAELANAYYKRIGNMVLMRATDNSIIGNGSFEKKKGVFARSPYHLTKMVAEYDEWGPEQIEHRQKYLAKLAVETWPIRIK